MEMRPAVAAVLVVGGVIALATLYLDPGPAVRYGLVGAIAILYFITKAKHWL